MDKRRDGEQQIEAAIAIMVNGRAPLSAGLFVLTLSSHKRSLGAPRNVPRH